MRRFVSAAGLMALCAALASQGGCAPSRPAANQSAGRTAVSEAGQVATPRARHAATLLAEAARTLRGMRKAETRGVLDAAIAESRALVIFPGVYQAGFLYSVRAGDGVLVARRPDGGWGSPVFVGMAGAGYGLQAGLEKSRLLLAVTEEPMVERLLAGSLDLDATTVYDILGVREQTGPGTLTAREPVMAFTDGVGMMAGIALHGGALYLNRGLTQSYYGVDSGPAEDVLRRADAPGMEVFALWGALGVAPAGPAIRVVARP